MLRGETIKLAEKIKTGEDEFGRDVYDINWVDVKDVLIGQPTSEEVLGTLQLHGKKAAFTIAIPKDDTHDWTDTEVQFFGQTFKTIGAPVQGIENLIPLRWNKKVQVERIEN